MNTELIGKRLLILGGSIWKKAIKDFADRNGIVLISAGLYPAGIDEIAQEVYRIDTTLPDLMIQFVKEHRIDGVYMGGSELIISSACQWINEVGLPCYCTKDQWQFLQNKRNFKELCIRFDLPVAPRYQINQDDVLKSVPLNAFPVITKPEDGSGSNGFSVCYSPMNLVRGYDKAATNSPSHTVICEKYVKNDSVVVFYTFSQGQMYFSGLEDKISVKFRKQGSYVGGLFVFESTFTEEFRHRFEDKLCQLFQFLGIREGSAWIEVFHDKDDYYFNEVGFRYGGSVSIYPVDYLYNYNQVAADIYYALTGKSKIEGHPSLIDNNIPRKRCYAIYPVYLWPGVIADIDGVEVIEKKSNVIICSLTKHIGSVIPDSGSFNQNFALIHFVYDTVEECGDMLRFIHSTLKVKNESGKDLVFKMLDFDAIEMQFICKQIRFPSLSKARVGEESIAEYFRRRMMDVKIYGSIPFQVQFNNALQTFLTRKQLADTDYVNWIGNDIIESWVYFKIRPNDYFLFGFNTINRSFEERNKFVTDTLKDKTLIDVEGWNNYLELSDKFGFSIVMKPFFKREIMEINQSTSFTVFLDFAKRNTRLFVKPNSDSYGNGARVFEYSDEEKAELFFKELKQQNVFWIVEKCIIQSEPMSRWNPSSVNTVRLNSFLNQDGFFVLAPFMRSGRKGSIVDNGGAGGMYALIDEYSGVITTDAYNEKGERFVTHPDSGYAFKGQVIPQWEELLTIAEKAHRLIPHHIYVSWDFALTDEGWIIVEGNWGQFIAQQTCSKRGYKQEFLRYMNGGSIV